MNQVKGSFFHSAAQFLKKDISLSLTLGYLLLLLLGLLYNFFYFGYFGVNPLAYAELTDFLVAPIRQPLVLAFFALTIVLAWATFAFDKWILIRFPNAYRRMSFGFNPHLETNEKYKNSMILIGILSYTILSTVFIADWEINQLNQKDAPKVELVLKTENEGLKTEKYVMIGKIGNYILVKADTSKRATIIFPIESVHSIRVNKK